MRRPRLRAEGAESRRFREGLVWRRLGLQSGLCATRCMCSRGDLSPGMLAVCVTPPGSTLEVGKGAQSWRR